MTNKDVSNQAPNNNHSPVPEQEVMAELWSLLLEHQQAQVNQPLGQQPSQNHPTAEEEVMAELRSLLLGSELQARLNEAKLRPDDLCRLLPEAIILRTMQDEQLTKAMQPTVEQAIQSSVKQDLNVLADSLFPVIGPATRKAVSTALKTLNESLNQTLDHSLSPQSFRWRLEARQTGKTFAEVVLLRTLVYRVEQVFLIHKQTGLVLQHVVADAVDAQDADLVSAMLRAIQDFVQDSFSVSKDDALDTLQFGELTIWIEQGPHAIVAAAIRGNAPQELRLVFQTGLEKIHKQFRSALISFQGDNAPFESSSSYLEDCLQTQYQAKKSKPSPILFILLGAIFCSLGIWSFFYFQERQRWTNYVENLNSQPGIVVVNAEKRHGKYFIFGLRDPLATDPIKLMRVAKLNPKDVISNWEPYLSFDAKFTATRAKQLLQPPKSVSLITENSILYANGHAPRQWILSARKLARGIPGITQFRTDNLIATEFEELQLSKKQIESQTLYFSEGNAQLLPGQEVQLKRVVKEIKKITDLAPFVAQNVRIEIIGHANNDGSQESNLRLSQVRADAVLSTLVSQGLKKTNLAAIGVGTREWQNESRKANKESNRRVSFKVLLSAPQQKYSEL